MKINDIIKETASSGGTSAGAVASVANPGKKSKTKRNKDGTVKNALDMSDNIMGGKTVKR